MPTERRIKNDAQITLTFGTSFIANLQAAAVFLCSLLSEQQSEQLLEMIEKKNLDLDDPLMKHSVTLVLLLREIENKAVETNQFVDTEVSTSTD